VITGGIGAGFGFNKRLGQPNSGRLTENKGEAFAGRSPIPVKNVEILKKPNSRRNLSINTAILPSRFVCCFSFNNVGQRTSFVQPYQSQFSARQTQRTDNSFLEKV
jgi:hypothetical protein